MVPSGHFKSRKHLSDFMNKILFYALKKKLYFGGFKRQEHSESGDDTEKSIFGPPFFACGCL